ncbi:competence protein CoiA [Streptococcus zalophi]|uniref:Competence protein CoiA n=1 Tax=Streptococcus zalophi TaxID=640031 RepID=A0A934UE30_9STRE|nr:competence protein CoiA family protein [Streptococcus zalophi]MBJ8350399.1 competence protein CoiA [Streptococcus zalophi]MCR8967861.1 competence protein CoiA family protein [Streptococcus zalophi]
MLTANNKNGKRINLITLSHLDKKALVKESFTCCACRQPVRLRFGQIYQAHFAHIRLKDCLFTSENEGEEHLGLKSELYHALSKKNEVTIETILPKLNQIADLLVNQSLALEIQCSPLSQKRLKERTKSYQKNHYTVLWLLGHKLWLGDRITSLQKQLIYFSKNIGFYLYEVDLKKRCLRIKYLIYEDLKGKSHYLEKSCSFDEDLLMFLRFPYLKQKMSSYQIKMADDILFYIQKQLCYKSPKWLKKQAYAYQAGNNILLNKQDDFYPQVNPLKSDNGFAQITANLSAYYQNFEHYYQKVDNKRQQTLYPPKFYDTIQ